MKVKALCIVSRMVQAFNSARLLRFPFRFRQRLTSYTLFGKYLFGLAAFFLVTRFARSFERDAIVRDVLLFVHAILSPAFPLFANFALRNNAEALSISKHRAVRIVRHPIVLKSHLRFGQERRCGLRQSVGVILMGQALMSQRCKAVSTAEQERRN
jgi:hypothetical protein